MGKVLLLIAIITVLKFAKTSPIEKDWFHEALPPKASGTRISADVEDFSIYRSLWWHNKRFYGVLDGSPNAADSIISKPALSMNTGLMWLPVNCATDFYQNLKAGWVGGTSLLIDLAFPAFPDNMGHWAEALLPIYNVLEEGAWESAAGNASSVIDTVIFVNLNRAQLAGLDWVWEMLKLSLSAALPPRRDLPRILFYDQLDHMDKAAWLGLETALVVNDRYARKDERNGFMSPELGRKFREAAYRSHKMEQPQLGPLPRTITLLTAVQGEEVVNRDELLEALHDVAHTLGLRVRPYTATARAPFESYLAVMARSAVVVSRHGPLLANSIFLPPGAVVMELLPYNWEWKGISKIYLNLTCSMGDIHHLAWRATHPRWAVYGSADDARYADWTPQECNSRDCLDVHARAAMRVDTATVQELLMRVLPGVLRGESVESLRMPWPELVRPNSSTGLWWDK